MKLPATLGRSERAGLRGCLCMRPFRLSVMLWMGLILGSNCAFAQSVASTEATMVSEPSEAKMLEVMNEDLPYALLVMHFLSSARATERLGFWPHLRFLVELGIEPGSSAHEALRHAAARNDYEVNQASEFRLMSIRLTP